MAPLKFAVTFISLRRNMPLIDISVLTACRLFITWAWVFCGSVEEHLDFNQIYTGWRNTILHFEITNAIEVRITVRYDNHTRSKGVIIRLKDKWQTLGGRVDIDECWDALFRRKSLKPWIRHWSKLEILSHNFLKPWFTNLIFDKTLKGNGSE